MANNSKVSSGNNNYEDETIERLLSKNLNKTTSYLISNTKQAFTKLRQIFIKALIL